MDFTPPDIEAYCINHSTFPSAAVQEIEKTTKDAEPRWFMLIGQLQGSFLGFLVSLLRPRRILEIGCYTGYSALCMAEKLDDSAEIITLDIDPDSNEKAKLHWAKSSHGKKISTHLGPALETIPRLAGKFDLVFIDADKPNYLNYFKMVLPRLAENGIIIADNCLYAGQVLNPSTAEENGRAIDEFNRYIHSQPDLESVLLPVRDGIHFIRRKD